MTAVRGGPAGPDGVGGSYQNEAETDRTLAWLSLGSRSGIIRGLTLAGVSGSMALDLSAGAAMVSELDGSNNEQQRGYLVWADATTRVTFGPASTSARNDALVAAFVDTEDGPVGTGGLPVGAHLVAIPGVSGTTTPRTVAQITAYLGRGGWYRIADVPIASTDTQINMANLSATAVRRDVWNSLPVTGGSLAAGSGWSLQSFSYRFRSSGRLGVRIGFTRTGADLPAAGSDGNIPDQIGIVTGIPTNLRPDVDTYVDVDRVGYAVFRGRVTAGGSVDLTSIGVPSLVVASGQSLSVFAEYDLP